METEGPPIHDLTRRLAECPAEFLQPPRLGGAGKVHVAAVVADLVRDLGGQPLTAEQAGAFRGRSAAADRNRLSLVLVACWLLHHPAFQSAGLAEGALRFLTHGLGELAEAANAPIFVTDPDRREELARLCLQALGMRPAGETAAQAEDRLTTLSTAERQRVVQAARAAEERARQIREAMARKAAEEANAKAMRE